MNPSYDSLRILIVADDPLARSGLANLLENHPDCTVTGQVAPNDSLVADLELFTPDVIVFDIGWAPSAELLNAYQALMSEISEENYPVIVLIPDTDYAETIRFAGVQGILLRDSDGDKLFSVGLAVTQNVFCLDPSLMDSVLAPSSSTLEELAEDLTTREVEVLHLLAEGLTNRAIAQRLDISEHTIKFHVNAILTKLNAQSRTEAVVRAMQIGLITL